MSTDQLLITAREMAKQLQNAQTICGNRMGWDTEDDLMILITPWTFSPVPENDQETVCWFEPFVDEVSVGVIIQLESLFTVPTDTYCASVPIE